MFYPIFILIIQKHTEKLTNMNNYAVKPKHADKQTYKHTDTDKHTDKHNDKHTDKSTDKHEQLRSQTQ